MPVLEVVQVGRAGRADESEVAKRVGAAWWAVVARFLIHGLIVSTWVSRIPAIKAGLGLSNASLGLGLLGTAVGSVVAIPVTGWLINRLGSKRVTTWSSVGFCLALVAPTFAVSVATLFLALIIYGAMAGANDVAMNSQAVAVESALGTPTMSRFHGMFSIGGMLGATLGGVVASLGVEPRVHFAIAAAFLLIVSGCTGPILMEAHEHSENQEKKRMGRVGLKKVPGVLVTLAVIGFCMFLSEGAMADWTAVYLKQDLAASVGLAAAGYAVFSAGMGLCRLLGDAVTKRLGAVVTLRTGALLAAAGLTFALLAQSSEWALPGLAVTGAGFAVVVPLVFSAGGRVKSLPSGVGIAMVSGSGYIGFLFGPPMIGFLAEGISLRAALFTVVGLSLLAATLAKAVDGETGMKHFSTEARATRPAHHQLTVE